MRAKRLGTSGFGLKRLAVASMLIDHFDSFVLTALLERHMTDGALTVTAEMAGQVQTIFLLKSICNALGRVAFPIFCFLLVEGVVHTHDRVGYGLRMGAFALLSEIPFDLAHYHRFFAPRLQNVMFTLTVCIFTLLLIAQAERRWARQQGVRVLAVILITLAGGGAAFLLRGEYVFLGVFAAVAFYLLREKGWLRLLGLTPLFIVSPWVALAAPAIILYNGKRGRGSQWFFYIFYPAHFLAFAAAAAWIAGMAP